MLGRLVNGVLRPAPTCFWDGAVMYANPTEEVLLAHGYLPVRETPPPAPTEGVCWVPTYAEAEGEIRMGWEAQDDAEEIGR